MSGNFEMSSDMSYSVVVNVNLVDECSNISRSKEYCISHELKHLVFI